ncbi:MAG: hypothetical protein IIY07_04585, partial [Thermoguttaceae bacterium]|nr:hypothetical protein [Thermoguttaceae bacterium]
MGKLLEGAAWFATLSLATAGGLTFVPDAAWESFPTALRPARAKLAEIGVAPPCYRADVDAKKADALAANPTAPRDATGGEDGENAFAPTEDAWLASTSVQIGERWKRVREVDETAFVDNWSESVATLGTRAQGRRLGAEAVPAPEVAAVEEVAEIDGALGVANDWPASNDVASWETETPAAAPIESAPDDEAWSGEAIPPFVEELDGLALADGAETAVANVENETPAPFHVVENLDASVDAGALNEGSAAGENAPVADASNGDGLNNGAGINAPSNLLEQADAAIANDLNAETPVAPAAPVDETAELRDALAAASSASTPEEIKTVFETLNRIRDERGARLAAEDAQALNAALDRLAFDVFYNPAQAR